MSTEVFILYKPHSATHVVIDRANAIIDEYLAQDFKLTLRQLFYQFVSRDYIENTMRHYKTLGRIIRNARDGGLIDWDAIDAQTQGVGRWKRRALWSCHSGPVNRLFQ